MQPAEPASSEAARRDADLQRFYTSWSWKREHLPDRERFRRPYTYELEQGGGAVLRLKQAQFKATGFASTGAMGALRCCYATAMHGALQPQPRQER